jgi:hypothetical protein
MTNINNLTDVDGADVVDMSREAFEEGCRDYIFPQATLLVGSKWVRGTGYQPELGPYVDYTVTVVTNTAHPHERHPSQVIYEGSNGNVWSLPLSEWPGSLVPKAEIDELRAELEKAVIPLIPEGYALVPIEPTDKMRHAFWRADERYENGLGEMPDSGWEWMLRAASEEPKP